MISGINHITLAVTDLEEAFRFYSQVLEFTPLAKRRHKSAYLLAGNDWIALVESKNKGAITTSYSHIAFSVSESDFGIISAKLKTAGAKIWQENSSPGDSLYFLDPSGNRLEIHSGTWKTRIAWLQKNPSDELEIFEVEP